MADTRDVQNSKAYVAIIQPFREKSQALASMITRIATHAFLSVFCGAACADQAALDEFITEAPKAWKGVRSHYNSGTAFDRTNTETLTFYSKKLSKSVVIQEKVSRNEIARIDNHISMHSHIVAKKINESLGLKAPPISEVEPKITDVSTVLNPQYKGKVYQGPSCDVV